ncbi:MAG: gliding motility-associated C-terminal domain-containing protein [Saprospirales bacterium]|nr:gliding motility-associated C-terminal domain-containing protein [Saprospirales bacterium]
MKNWNSLLLACFLLFTSSISFSQATIELTVTGGTATTTCTDLFSSPDPLWSVEVENGGWVNYPLQGFCYTALPNVQFSQTYTCLTNAPATINVCFRAFENDGTGICSITAACEETICQNFAVPTTPGSLSYTLALPNGQSSGGNVQFTISASGTGAMDNEAICGAVDAGVLDIGDSWGDASASTWFNFCASAAGDPSPADQGASWYNNVGLWFTFTTGPTPTPYVRILANSDPENLGDPLNLQVAIWTTSDGTCTGAFTLVDESFINGNWNETLQVNCLQPNTTYFVLVDGTADTQPELWGYFGLSIEVLDVLNAGDIRCTATPMGPIPDGGSVVTGLYTNICATSAGDPNPSTFFGDKPVWFTFQPPASGHVLIQATSNPLDAINIQMALYRSSNNACNGVFTEIDISYTSGNLDESIEISCLDPTRTYWVLIDGATNNRDGIFSMTISDEGDDTPVTNQAFVFCAGGSISVGPNLYTTSGLYVDTLLLPGGCDSVVITDLTVLSTLIPSITNVVWAGGLGNNDASALAGATGGLAPYSYLWSNGQTSAQGTGLVGGSTACVTITDDNGCVADTCFSVPYYTFISPTVVGDSLDCAGDTDGTIIFSAVGGLPPYSYTWNNTNNTLSGNGAIASAGQQITLPNLPAGTYVLSIEDGLLDTTVNVVIWEPLPLSAQVILQTNASCFSECDAQLEIQATGGTSPYQYSWSNSASGPKLSDICAGMYTVTVEDAKGCTFVQTYTLTQPVEFIASIQVLQNVSCFQGADGMLTVTAIGGTPASYQWSNLGQTATISGLNAGSYTVTVTNQDGCQDIATANVTQPAAPVGVSVQLLQEISCFGSGDGVLQAVASGPGNSFNYSWSNGASGSTAQDLGPGSYTVTVSNELGCSAETQASLTQPTEIVADILVEDITCETIPIGGSIAVESVNGGEGPYLYSLDGLVFLPDTAFLGLSSGAFTVYISDATGCEKSYPVTVLPPPVLLLDLGDDQTITLGEPVELTAMVNSSDAVFNWVSDIGSVDCLDASCEDVSLLPVESGLVYVDALDTLTKCRASDSLYIQVLKERKLYIPNAFTPNFDGVNDYFIPYGEKGVEQISLLRIFDRNGALVFEAIDLQPGDEPNGWDGTFGNRLAAGGVYAYLAEVRFIDDVVLIYKGDVALVR